MTTLEELPLSDQVLNVLKTLNEYQQNELYHILKKKHEEQTESEYPSLHEKTHEMMDKYGDLVWYARKFPEDRRIPGVVEAMTEVENKYPKELQDFNKNPEWTHGFNSGMLAASRLFHAYSLDPDWTEIISNDDSDIIITRDTEIEMAEDMFPCLDT